MQIIAEKVSVKSMLAPTALNNTNTTTPYAPVRNLKRHAFAVAAALAAGKTLTIQAKQAKDAAGTDAKDIAGATAVVTANTSITGVNLNIAAGVADDTIVIVQNGVTYTYTQKAATSIEDRQYADAAGLISCLQEDGFDNVFLASANNVVVEDSVKMTATQTGDHVVISTLAAIALVEFTNDDLDSDFPFIAVNVATTDNTTFNATLIETDAILEPVAQMAASTGQA